MWPLRILRVLDLQTFVESHTAIRFLSSAAEEERGGGGILSMQISAHKILRPSWKQRARKTGWRIKKSEQHLLVLVKANKTTNVIWIRIRILRPVGKWCETKTAAADYINNNHTGGGGSSSPFFPSSQTIIILRHLCLSFRTHGEIPQIYKEDTFILVFMSKECKCRIPHFISASEMDLKSFPLHLFLFSKEVFWGS